MSPPPGKTRIRRRGALLLILASLAAASPLAGLEAVRARADDDGGGSGGDGGGGGGSGSDDGGSDDGGNDDGGSDDGGDRGGSSGSESGGRSGGSQGSKSGGSSQGTSTQQRDGALARRLKGRIAPVREIEAVAGRAVPGEVIDIKLYRNKDTYVYRVKILQTDGSIYDVRIDAVSRNVLSAKER